MPPESTDDTSTLERLRQKLYAQNAPETLAPPVLTPEAPHQPSQAGWQIPAEPPKPKARLSFAVLFLGIAVVFFVLALGAAAYFLIFNGRAVSTNRIEITVDSDKTSISSGDTVTLLFSVENKNPVAALDTSLGAMFPESTRASGNEDMPFVHYNTSLGTIPAGETGTQSLPVQLFGTEGDHITIPVRVEYRIEGSNAVYVKETDYEVEISSSPITITAKTVSEVAVGQPVTFAISVRSNAKTVLDNVTVFAQYPFGFTPKKGEGPMITVGTLQPNEERTLTFTGTLTGEDADERVFKFTVGTRKDTTATTLDVPYATAVAPVVLAKPFLATTLSLDRDTTDSPVIAAGASVQSVISWVNTLAAPVLDGQVTVKLSGAPLNTASISTYGGFYRSSDTSVVFSKETSAGLSKLDPGATGNGSFTFKSKTGEELVGMRNPTITATVSVAGRRVGESNVPETISTSMERTIKIATDLGFSGNSFYSTGPFKNTGPWPPVADKETTYTITFALSNTVNTVADATVSGTLPSYVRFTNATSPTGEVSYNETTRVVTWRAGEIVPGTGYAAAPRQASFQVALLPSASQRGTSPILVSGITVTGVDKFTQKKLSNDESPITTEATKDPSYLQGNGEVH